MAIRDRLKKGNKPKAVILVHLYGMPAKIKEIREITSHYEIPLIEDAAEALGSRYHGQMVGTFTDMSILSFNGNKIITTSGGGALVTTSPFYAQNTLYLSTQAKDNMPHYQHSAIGYNYRMSNIVAGIGRGQMEVIEQRIRQRRERFQYYYEALNDIKEISFLEEPKGHFSNYWLTTLLVKPNGRGITREDVRKNLEADQIDTRHLWKPMHLQPIYEKYPCYMNGTATSLFEKGLCLPSGSNLSQEDADRVVQQVKKTFQTASCL